MKTKILLLLICIIKLQGTPFVLNLESALEIGMSNSEEIKLAKEELKIANYRYKEAFSGALPQINGSVTYMQNLYSSKIDNIQYGIMKMQNSIINLHNYHVNTDPNYPAYNQPNIPLSSLPKSEIDAIKNHMLQWKIDIVQPIWLGGKVGSAIEIAKIYQEIVNIKYKMTEMSLKKDIKKSFFSIIISKKIVEVLNLTMTDAELNYQNLQKMYTEGLISEYDLLKAKVRVNSIKPKLLRAKHNLQLAKDNLKTIIGLKLSSTISITGSLPSEYYKPNDYYEQALSNRQEIQLLQNQKLLLQENVDIEFSAHLPSLLAVGNYTFSSKTDDISKTFKKNHGVNAVSAGLTLKLPIFSGFRDKAKVDKAKVEVKKVEINLEKVTKFIKLELDKAYKSIIEAQEEVEIGKIGVKEAEKALEIANARYANGVGTQIEVVDAQTNLEKAHLQKLTSQYQLSLNILAFNYALGKDI